ncbi:hypothetical protein [Amycolatopsis suaedae]|uniref:Uncharacterized protein n=1 Tax=Amycolatopsis suaedae TaxID=2510978 RepID=A0A4Q7J287_9PSEU|nr:hypothetical protein [Amycolatopsis suaedae]RZQ60858.1 hypothetical protein EWH70_27555 [Amycolatopsis suaedae]
MTGPEHYRAAEQQLAAAAISDGGSDSERYHLATAQVHATPALAAATAATPPVRWSDQDLQDELARGYAFGRLAARGAEPGPLVHSNDFVAAARARDVRAAGLHKLYAELQASAGGAR